MPQEHHFLGVYEVPKPKEGVHVFLTFIAVLVISPLMHAVIAFHPNHADDVLGMARHAQILHLFCLPENYNNFANLAIAPAHHGCVKSAYIQDVDHVPGIQP